MSNLVFFWGVFCTYALAFLANSGPNVFIDFKVKKTFNFLED